MAAGDIALKILLAADASSALGVIGSLGGGFAGIAVAAGAAAVGIGVQAVKMAGDFQASMTRLVTSAGELPQNLKMVSDGILKMSVDTATTTTQLAAGMYYVESSGYHGAAGLNVLKVAAEGAKSENADLTVVSKALTTAMIDYHMPATQAASAMNGLIAAVQNGKTSLQDLSGAMGAVLPIGSALGISFPQIAGSLDTMTNAGMSAQQAAQNLAHVLVALQAPNSVAVKSMTAVGLSAQGVRDALVHQGLPEALQLIEQHVGEKFPAGSVAGTTALKNILGGIVGLKLAAMLTGDSLKETETNINNVASAMNGGKGAVMGWDLVQQTWNFKMDQAKNALSALMITIGTQLLPVLTPLIGQITTIISQFAGWIQSSGIMQTVIKGVISGIQSLVGFITNLIVTGSNVVKFFQQNQWAAGLLMVAIGALGSVMALFAASSAADMILSLLATMLTMTETAAGAVEAATTMTAGFGVMAGSIIADMAGVAMSMLATLGPFLLVGAIIAGVIIGVILIVKNWGAISTWLQGVWANVVSWFQGAMQNVGNAVSGVINWFNQWKPLILTIGGIILTLLGPALVQAGVNAAIAGGQMLGSFVTGLVTSGTAAATSAAGGIAAFVSGIIKSGVEAVIAGGKFVAGLIPSIISFGTTAITTAATAIPAMITGFISWAVAGWAAAAATIAATWPILLIIAAILLLVGIIILLVTHWSQVVSFLTNVWNAVAGFFVSVWNHIVDFFVGIWTNIVNFAREHFLQILAVVTGPIGAIVIFVVTHWNQILAFLKNIWNAILSAVQSALAFLVNIFTAPFRDIGALFVWLYNHNYYFQALVDSIRKIITTALAWLQGAWQGAINWLVGLWNSIVGIATTTWRVTSEAIMAVVTAVVAALQDAWNTATGWLKTAWNAVVGVATTVWNAISGAVMTQVHLVTDAVKLAWNTLIGWLTGLWNGITSIATTTWNAVTGAIQTGVNTVTGWIQTAWNTATKWLSDKWNTFKDMMGTAWKAVSGLLSGVWNTYIAGPLGSIWTNFTNWFNNLAQQALQWGQNLIQGFINGILNMASSVTNAVSGIAHNVASFLGFHSPSEKGPGSTAHLWAPALVTMFAGGLLAGVPRVAAASSALASAISTPLAHPASFAVRNNAFALPTNPNAASGPNMTNLTIQLDSRTIGKAVLPMIGKEIRIQGGVRAL